MGLPLQGPSNGPQISKVLKFATPSGADSQHHPTLQGWKAIAAELDRGIRTVQRWERTLNLPVHRLGEGTSCPVFAFKDELQRWLRDRAAQSADRNVPDALPGHHQPTSIDNRSRPSKNVTVKGSEARGSDTGSEPEIIKSLNSFFALKGSAHKESTCSACSSSTRLLVGQFWLYGTDNAWQVSIPFCPRCDSDVRALLPPSTDRVS